MSRNVQLIYCLSISPAHSISKTRDPCHCTQFQGADKHETWIDYFDLIVVSACKPAFFSDDGFVLREVDLVSW